MTVSRDRRSCRGFMFVTFMLLWSSPAFTQADLQKEQQIVLTKTPVEVEAVGDKKVRYPVVLRAGEFFQVRVEQKDSEVLLRLLDASGKEVARMSSPKEKEGLETLSFVASESARYTLEAGLLKVQAEKGKFAIWREPPRVATSLDRRRVEVERLFAEGMIARDTDGQAETAVKKFSTARDGYRDLKDEYMVEMSDLLVTRSQGRAIFIEARKQLNDAKQPTTYKIVRAKFMQAAELYSKGGQAFNAGAALLGAAVASQGLGELESTIKLLEMALPAFSEPHTIQVKADLLDNLATFYLILDDVDTALDYLTQSRSIYIELKQTEDAARIENAIGELHLQIGRYKDSYPFLESSRKLRERNSAACGTSATLTNLAMFYYFGNDKASAREFLLDRALPLYPAGDECAGDKAKTLIVIGQFYYDLGSNDLALKYLTEAEKSLKTESEVLGRRDASEFDVQMKIVNNKLKMATGLNVVGAAKFALARYQETSISLSKANSEKAAEARANAKRLYAEARSAYEEALKLYREISDTKHEATVMTNIGVVQSSAGETDEALKTFEAALKVSRDADHKNAEAITLNNTGKLYSNRGEHRKALELFKQALPLLRAVDDKSGEAVALSYAMYDWASLGNRRMAIFSGKQAINIFQELRRGARGLNTEIQKDYLRSIRESYQRLAELLIEEGKNDHAIQILNLYQDQQFFDLDGKASVEQAIFSTRESDWVQRSDLESRTLTQLNSRIEDGKRRKIADRLSPDKVQNQLQALRADFTKATHVFITTLEEAEKEFAQPDEVGRAVEIESVTKMQSALDHLSKQTPPHKVVALYTLLGNDKFYVLLMTPSEIKAFTQDVSAEVLNRSIIKTFSDLQNPGFPEKVRASSSTLYNMILGTTSTPDGKSTLEAELGRLGPDTLLWSLDGILSYLPVAALYDAKKSQYLLEKYQNVVFTRADAERILRSPRPWKTAIGFGKSTASNISCEIPCETPPCDNRLKSLRLVPQELSGIFRRMRGDRTVVKGTIVLNEEFTQERMLQARNTPLVHIASHFCFQPGNTEESFLLLGNDKKFSLHDMSAHLNLYAAVDLLVLSACRTAALERNQMGKEIDSLAELSQRLGAASVIATLWNADEIGASRLMTKLYTLHKRRPELSKAELLRQAQLSLLRGNQTEPNTNLDHPYYWAPFVLYGSFR